MTDPKLNLRPLESVSVAESAPAGRLLLWGPPVAAAIIAAFIIGLVWLRGDLANLPPGEPRLRVVIDVLIILIVAVVLHLSLLFIGVYALAAQIFRKETGDRVAAPKPPNRDPRLHHLYEELRISHGWFWRNRQRWLLVSGTDERIDQVAPGLKQAAVMHVGETVLVHAAPEGIDAQKWLGQIRRLRRRRPVDGLVHVAHASETDTGLARKLSLLATALGWAAPVTFLHPVTSDGRQPQQFDAVGAFMTNDPRRQAQAAAASLPELLSEIEHRTAHAGVRVYLRSDPVTWLLHISKYVADHRKRMVECLQELAASNWLRAPLAGVMFAPVFPAAVVVPVPVANGNEMPGQPDEAPPVPTISREQPAALLPVWRKIAASSSHYRSRRTRLYWSHALAVGVTVAAISWTAMLMISGFCNLELVTDIESIAATALAATPGTPPALRAQLALQKQIDMLEYRQQHGVPWYLRAGLSRNDELLSALWQPYGIVAARNLRQPVVQALETQLAQLSQIRADEQQGHDAQQLAYNRLKAYLMLATPARTDASFLKAQLLDTWPAPAAMRTGEWLDTSQQLAGFWASHLKTHPGLRSNASLPLVTQMRSTLVNQIGLAASDEVLYQRVLDDARGKYADVSLATLLAGADAHGLFATTQTVPGIFTRAAWDGAIGKAIDEAAKQQHVEGDWVLSGEQPAVQMSATALEGAVGAPRATSTAGPHEIDDLRTRLRNRYFTDYTSAWAGMLNSLQWIPATSFSGVIDQLTRLTDAQTSPLLALMRSVQYQGQAGRPSQALADTLVRKAQGLLGGGDTDATMATMANPLDRSFGPLLALLGEATPASVNGRASSNVNAANSAAFNGVSLSRTLTAATTVRLKLQQIQSSPDAQSMARALAQAVFQGKLSDLTQARDDASLTAASLGAQWAGFGQAMFVQPLDSAWQAVLQPAAASLNEAWRVAVAAPFASMFASRYPFSATTADASFADLGRYVRPDTGLMNRFIESELSGVLKRQGEQWVPNELAPQSLQFDPAFLAMLRLIGPLGARLYARGEAAYHFALMAQPTPDVPRTELMVDGQQLAYFNQRESWSAFAWPGNGLNGRALLTWQTTGGGLRIAFDVTGDWAFLRLLEKAQIKSLDDTRYELVWHGAENGEPTSAASDSTADTSSPLHYLLRVQAGAGPLELLKLRGFRMPERIFVTGRAGTLSALAPLPAELQP